VSEYPEKVIFANGCFDIIHRGHLELLRFARNQGDKLIIGLNSDSSVKALKGNSRPINNQEDRKFVLECINFVDEVHIFNEETPYKLIKEVLPDIIVKGGDYLALDVVGSDLCEIIIFELVDGYSSTKIIQNFSDR
jgi:rfaE bifunctional protein nucleotidyltransferase chain/domain